MLAHELRKVRDLPARRWLVYTSAGDRSNVARWLGEDRSFDLWITYYGSAAPAPLEGLADYFNVRKGSKFQNLHDAYQQWPDIWTRYSAVLVMDDDILIDAHGIGELFRIREAHDYWIIQPGFSPLGKISHAITRARHGMQRRDTNFVEMNCPLFKREVLDRFMKVYDPVLTGWGTDWLYLDMLGVEIAGKVAIVDGVRCINPHDVSKGGREIERLQSKDARRATWARLKVERGITIDERDFKVYSRVKNISPLRPLAVVADAAEDWWLFALTPLRKKLSRRVRRKWQRLKELV